MYLLFSYVDYDLLKWRRNDASKTCLCAERSFSPVAPDLEMSKLKRYGTHFMIISEHHWTDFLLKGDYFSFLVLATRDHSFLLAVFLELSNVSFSTFFRSGFFIAVWLSFHPLISDFFKIYY